MVWMNENSLMCVVCGVCWSLGVNESADENDSECDRWIRLDSTRLDSTRMPSTIDSNQMQFE
jgi:hypothetical protein